MLAELTVGNFRSFRDPQTLSMLATKLKSEDERVDTKNTFDAPTGLKLLTSAVVYGANASGKSNLVQAAIRFREIVLRSASGDFASAPGKIQPFALDKDSASKPGYYEAVFIINKRRYRYGFKIGRAQILEEWLYYVPKSRETMLFEREGGSFELSKKFRDADAEGLLNKVRPDALLVSVAAQFNGKFSSEIVDWCSRFRPVSAASSAGYADVTEEYLANNIMSAEIRDFVRRLDLDIQDIRIEKKDPEDSLDASGVPKGMQMFLGRMLPGMRYATKTTHTVYGDDGETIGMAEFDMMAHESEGTQKAFSLAGPLIEALSRGLVLMIDELDSQLHPHLTSAIIDLFASPELNKNGAQLIFTTHDTQQLSKDRFRRDQVWLTEKVLGERTELVSLAEYKVRNDASYSNGYLSGRYGAIPDLSLLPLVSVGKWPGADKR